MEAKRKVFIGGNTIKTDKVMKEREPHDFYETDEACLNAYFRHPVCNNFRGKPLNVLDPSAGRGVWGKVIRNVYPTTAYMCGNDIQENMFSTDLVFTYDTWLCSDYLKWTHHIMRPDAVLLDFDLVATNPPYKYAEEFFWKSREMVHRDGSIIFLLRLGFMASERRYNTMWTKGYRPSSITVCSTRPSFSGDGKTYPGDFAFFRWDFYNNVCDEDTVTNYLVYDRVF